MTHLERSLALDAASIPVSTPITSCPASARRRVSLPVPQPASRARPREMLSIGTNCRLLSHQRQVHTNVIGCRPSLVSGRRIANVQRLVAPLSGYRFQLSKTQRC